MSRSVSTEPDAAINCRPGYRSVYGEIAKWVLDACVFIEDRLLVP
jgi:hypothetical protein